MAAASNRRFHDGRSSSSLAAAGVLVHQFDGTEVRKTPWLASEEEATSDRWSSTILSPDTRHLYSRAHSGWVFSPTIQQDGAILCAYPFDGGTVSFNCDHRGAVSGKPGLAREEGCVPGCFVPGHTKRCTGDELQDCAFAPDNLQGMLTAHAAENRAASRYNEVVVDTAVVHDALPRAIEAVFFMVDREKADDDKTMASYERKARQACEQFRKTFRLGPNDLPLLALDLQADGDPFTEVSCDERRQ